MTKVKNNMGAYLFYRYASFGSDYSFTNNDFDKLLELIGTYHFRQPNAGLNKICGLIRDEINETWNLNRLRKIKQGKRVSANQIKTIRRSFNRPITNSNYILLPFDVVSIMFYILSILKSLEPTIPAVKEFICSINQTNVGIFLYNDHISILRKKYCERMLTLTDGRLRKKYENLKDRLTAFESLMNKKYDQIPWNELSEYKL